MTSTNVNSTTLSLEKIVERIFAFRQITPIDRELLKTVLLSKDSFTSQDHSQINRVYEGVRSGTIWVIKDEK
ncbi:MAG: hypothetical protein F6K35_45695 [Okeania sp. SIO2H7]|nr:hypothetical protein [Okeania sp. SIO2H7]